jgi:muramoyltetrapeptide carboxypeptidase
LLASRNFLPNNQGVSTHIYIYSPSGAVRDKASFRLGVRRLQRLGYEVELDVDALSSYQRFAGDDEIRLAAIHRAAASGANIALISRGGYGLTRILGRIQYEVVAKAIESGTEFVGLSDFTAFQLAVLAKIGGVTWAGPVLCEAFGQKEDPDEIMQDCFQDLVLGQGEGTGWRQSPFGKAKTNTLKMDASPILKIEDATIWGGNLTIVASLLGTPFFPNVRNGILFLEDVGEHPYRIERALTQLLHAGVLGKQRAIIFGQFTEFRLSSHDKGFNMKTVVDGLRSQINVPVLTNLPFGHVPTKVLLPVGAKADLVVDGRDVMMVWGHEIGHSISTEPPMECPKLDP